MANQEACVSCKCCFGLFIDVTGLDLYRLAVSLHLDPMTLVTTAPSDETDDDLGFCLEPGGPTKTLILRQRGTTKRRCALLLGPLGTNGETRCGVYPIRPAACRSYPAEFAPDAPGQVRRRSIARCPVGSFTPSAVEDATLTEAMDASTWGPLLRDEQIGLDVHRIVTWRWNRHVLAGGRRLSLAELVGYLMAVHERLAPVWAVISERPDWSLQREAWGSAIDNGISPFLAPPGETPALDPIRTELRDLVAIIESSFPDDPW